jgi:hypothetical protein
MRSQNPLLLEALEERAVPTANLVALQGSTLNILVDPDKSHAAVISQTTTGATTTVNVQLDNQNYSFTNPVTQLNYLGGGRNDHIINLTNIGGDIFLGDGNNVVNSKAANEMITAGKGNNIIQDFSTGSTIQVGNGNNNLYGGPGDTITAGSGKNIIYDILGANTISVAAHRGHDYIFTNATSTVTGAASQDSVAVFFASNRLAGSGTLVLSQGVLYFTANGNGDTYIVNEVGNQVVATYNLNDGTGFHTQTFAKSAVKLLANFGGAGNDTFINNTNISDVQYGQGGNNLLIGGTGALDLEKAGGASGASMAIGRSPDYNDLTGSATAGVQTTLVVNPDAKFNIVRSNNPADVVIGFRRHKDAFVGPTPDISDAPGSVIWNW